MPASTDLTPFQKALKEEGYTLDTVAGKAFARGWKKAMEHAAPSQAKTETRALPSRQALGHTKPAPNGEDYDDTAEFDTYDGWQNRDFHVAKGEKACGHNSKGEAVFSADQVEENEIPDWALDKLY